MYYENLVTGTISSLIAIGIIAGSGYLINKFRLGRIRTAEQLEDIKADPVKYYQYCLRSMLGTLLCMAGAACLYFVRDLLLPGAIGDIVLRSGSFVLFLAAVYVAWDGFYTSIKASKEGVSG